MDGGDTGGGREIVACKINEKNTNKIKKDLGNQALTNYKARCSDLRL